MQGAPPPPLPALVHIPELLSSLVSNAPLVAGSATSSTSSPAAPASSPATPAGPAMYRALLEVLGGPVPPGRRAAGWRRRLAPPGCTGAATGPRAHPSEHAAQLSHASAGKELYLG
eukprot:tig00021043_g17632.t1